MHCTVWVVFGIIAWARAESENCSILLFDSEAALLLPLRTSIALQLLPEKHLFRQVASGPGARLRSHMATGRNNLEELHMILI